MAPSSHLGGPGVDAERSRDRRAPLDRRAVPPPRRGSARDGGHEVDEPREEVEGGRVFAEVQEEEPGQAVESGRGGAERRERLPELVVEDEEREVRRRDLRGGACAVRGGHLLGAETRTGKGTER